MKNKQRSVLIIGAAGGLANILCGLLEQNNPDVKILGIDNRNLKHDIQNPNFKFSRMRYSRTNFEKLFREEEFEVIYHLGRLSHARKSSVSDITERININIMGTNKILELAIAHEVKKVIVLSTHHVYGALSDNPVFINEDSPLRASIKYPELRDVTEMDNLCTNWMWKNQDNVEMVVLRPCNIIGPQINNTISQYLRAKLAPAPIDFNPMFQFIHELDMATILMHSLDKVPGGIYNVAPSETISLAEAKKVIGAKTYPFPISILSPIASIIKKLWTFPDYLIDYIKFSCIIDSSKIDAFLPEKSYRFSTRQALKLLKL